MSRKERWEQAQAHGKSDLPAGVLDDPDEDVADDPEGAPPPKDHERWDGDPPKPHGHP